MCCTACFKEEGKETSAGYSIFYYARANARASGSCEKSTRKQESRRFSISGKGRKGKKVPVWLEKTRQAASAKYKRCRMKNRDDGKKTWRAPAQNRQKKCSGNRKIPEWLIKKTASSIRKTQKIPDKNRNDGEKRRQVVPTKHERFQMKNQDYEEKTQQAPAQNRQKKCSENWKMPK